MGGILKLGVGAGLILVALAIWKYGFSSEEVPQSEGNLLMVSETDWVKGKSDASATLIEYTDFQCPACGAYYPIVKQVSEELGDKMKLVIRHYPLIQIHKNALSGARAAEAAGRQGKFWEMYDLLFMNQKEWSEAADPVKSILPSYAGKIGLDVEKFKADMADASLDDKINHDRETGNDLEISGTPSFFLNGKKMDNPKNLEDFKKTLEEAATK